MKPQASVQAFDTLLEVQSDKASVEITSPFEGTVKELLVQEGEIAKVGSGLCLIETEEEGTDGQESPSPVQEKPALSAEQPKVTPVETLPPVPQNQRSCPMPRIPLWSSLSLNTIFLTTLFTSRPFHCTFH